MNFDMKIEIERVTHGTLQHINRVSFVGADNKKVYVDLWDSEIDNLKELLCAKLSFKDSEGNFCY